MSSSPLSEVTAARLAEQHLTKTVTQAHYQVPFEFILITMVQIGILDVVTSKIACYSLCWPPNAHQCASGTLAQKFWAAFSLIGHAMALRRF